MDTPVLLLSCAALAPLRHCAHRPGSLTCTPSLGRHAARRRAGARLLPRYRVDTSARPCITAPFMPERPLRSQGFKP